MRPRSPPPPRRPSSSRPASRTSAARRSCRTCCAASASWRPRSAARSARPPTRRARRSRRWSTARRTALEPRELDARLAADASTSRCPARRSTPVGRLHLITAIRREIEDVFLGLGFRVAEGPEIDLVHYNFDALNHNAQHPARLESDTFYPRRRGPAHAHLADAGRARWRSSRRRCTSSSPGRTYRRDNDATHTPQFHQVEGLAVDEDITLADLKGTLLAFARAIFGDERDVRFRPHFFPFTEPSAEVDVSCHKCAGKGFLRDGARCNLCKGEGWIEILGAARSTPTSSATWRQRLRPRADPGLRLRHGHRADRLPQARRRRPAALLRQRPALPGAVRMRLPLLWLHDYTIPACRQRARGAPDDDRHEGRGRPRRTASRALEHFVVGKVLSAERHPDADRLTVCMVDIGRRRAVADRLRRAQRRGGPDRRGRAARRRDARRHAAEGGQAARPGVQRDDPGRGRGRHRHRPRRDHGPRRRARRRHAAGRRPADRHRRARARDHAEPARLPERLRRRARGPRRDRRAAGAAAVDATTRHAPGASPASTSTSSAPTCARASPCARSRT